MSQPSCPPKMEQSQWSRPNAAFGSFLNGELIGSNIANLWGSLSFFGPLTVRSDLWGQGVAKRLMEPVMECFASRAIRHASLFTFAKSQKHISLYQKFGFWQHFLTAILSKLVAGVNTARFEAYRLMLASGFRADFQGVAMKRPNDSSYNRPEAYIIDDWR
jgi:Acetyltransferase (GNAT) family